MCPESFHSDGTRSLTTFNDVLLRIGARDKLTLRLKCDVSLVEYTYTIDANMPARDIKDTIILCLASHMYKNRDTGSPPVR